MRITGLVVSAPDVPAAQQAWSRLDAGLRIEVVEGDPALAGVVLSVADVEATSRLLERRGVEVVGGMALVHGTTWLLRAEQDRPGGALALDHVVVDSPDAVAAAADFGGRLGLDLRLDRDTGFGFRGLFFRCGDAVVEVVVRDEPAASSSLSGAAWRCDVAATRDRLIASGVDVSEVRRGRKPGTVVATVRDADLGVPTLLVGPAAD